MLFNLLAGQESVPQPSSSGFHHLAHDLGALIKAEKSQRSGGQHGVTRSVKRRKALTDPSNFSDNPDARPIKVG